MLRVNDIPGPTLEPSEGLRQVFHFPVSWSDRPEGKSGLGIRDDGCWQSKWEGLKRLEARSVGFQGERVRRELAFQAQTIG